MANQVKPAVSDFEDFVADETGTTRPRNPTAMPDPGEVEKAIAEHRSPLSPDTEKAEKQSEEESLLELKQTAELQRKTDEMRDKFRLQQLREKPEIRKYAHLFLMDMAGAERFTAEYKPLPWLTLQFRVMNADDIEQITLQNVRDLILGRTRFPNEAKFMQNYRLAASLQRLQMTDPQNSGKVILVYDVDGNEPAIKAYSDDDKYVKGTDTPIRQLSLYLRKHVFVSGQIFNLVQEQFMEFESLLNDLLFVSSEDPDFFYQCLAEASSPA